MQGISRFPANRRIFHMPPSRQVFAGYSEFPGYAGIRRRGPELGRVREIRDPAGRSIAYDLQEVARFPREHHDPPHGPIAVGLRRLRRIILIRLNSTKTAPTWGGGAQYATPRIRGRSHRIFRKSRDPTRHPETVAWPLHGGPAPFTLISRDLSEFGENGAYVARQGEIRDPRIRGRLRRIRRKSRDFAATLRNFQRAPGGAFAPFTRTSLDLSVLCENGAYAARRNTRFPDPRQIA